MKIKKILILATCFIFSATFAGAQGIKQDMQRQKQEQQQREQSVKAEQERQQRLQAEREREQVRIANALLNLNSLIQLLQYTDLEQLDEFLSKKGWKMQETESKDGYKLISWAFDKQAYYDRAKAWFNFYLYSNGNNAVGYRIDNETQVNRIKSELIDGRYDKTQATDVSDKNSIKSVYRNSQYQVNLTKSIDNQYGTSGENSYYFFIYDFKKEEEIKKAQQQAKDAAIGIEMVFVKGGRFMMGATPEQGNEAHNSEKPAHIVTLSDYYIGKYEVTTKQWNIIMNGNLSNNLPITYVSWNRVQEFIRKLNAQTGKNYRLPTEAEWEYAARGGQKSKGYKYAGSDVVDNVAWVKENSNTDHPVGGKQPNELGIYDMSGNAKEMCNDYYGAYSAEAQTNPKGAASGTYRVARGGSYGNTAEHARIARRVGNDGMAIEPDEGWSNVGFRLALDVE